LDLTFRPEWSLALSLVGGNMVESLRFSRKIEPASSYDVEADLRFPQFQAMSVNVRLQ
jgi:hypothetical protein